MLRDHYALGMLTLLLTQTMAAAGLPNVNRSPDAAVVHAIGEDVPWGARVGATWMVAVGERCSWRDDCKRYGVWPLAGATAHASWRGGDRAALDVGGTFGLGLLRMHDIGFEPKWAALGSVAMRAEIGRTPALVLGASLARKLWFDAHPREMYRSATLADFDLVVDVSAAIGGLRVLPTVGVGVRLNGGYADFL